MDFSAFPLWQLFSDKPASQVCVVSVIIPLKQPAVYWQFLPLWYVFKQHFMRSFLNWFVGNGSLLRQCKRTLMTQVTSCFFFFKSYFLPVTAMNISIDLRQSKYKSQNTFPIPQSPNSLLLSFFFHGTRAKIERIWVDIWAAWQRGGLGPQQHTSRNTAWVNGWWRTTLASLSNPSSFHDPFDLPHNHESHSRRLPTERWGHQVKWQSGKKFVVFSLYPASHRPGPAFRDLSGYLRCYECQFKWRC